MANDTRDHESEYFHKQEKAKLQRLREQREADKAATEAQALKELHWHRCGKCGGAMDTQVFKGIEIEVCPGCGSVLLDPGELQQLAGEDKSSFANALGELFSFGRR